MTRPQWSLIHPPIEFPEILPITSHLDAVRTALFHHQVIVVAGETGSGKTTQLPKLMLTLGRGCRGRIGHTQPRRIAARTVGVRIASELNVSLGAEVGYQVRFHKQVEENTYIKLMTDGILLAELACDPTLKQYDTLIIDEAHERSVNIDLLLGYLKTLLPRRPDLKIIVTSATLDHQRFAAYFSSCPVIEVSGRSFPVTMHYQPAALAQQQSLEGARAPILNHVTSLGRSKRRLNDDPPASKDIAERQGILQALESFDNPHGDVLVFLTGEREIRQTAEFLRRAALRHTEILPLYAKLPISEQQKIFQQRQGLRRIILATNVAETALTIPNIHYVIDTGLARLKRYNPRSKIQRLLVEPISKASANQRAGRCGRVAPGVCVRLYSSDDFALRDDYTQPEILRTNLAQVILQMLVLNLSAVEDFPWIDPPETQYWRDAYQSLEELGAINRSCVGSDQLTPIGRMLAEMPIDPRLGRMVISAKQYDCLAEVCVIVSALSVADIFARPFDYKQAADEKHRLFADPRSDFLTFINVWLFLSDRQKHESQNKFRQLCDRYFLSYTKFKEWQDVHQELISSPIMSVLCKDLPVSLRLELPVGAAGEHAESLLQSLIDYPTDSVQWSAIHKSILSGLLTHVAQKYEAGVYLAARLRHVKLFPGSALFKKPPPWIMALEIVETKQVYARTLAMLEPAWIESLAPEWVKKTYSEPHWDPKRGAVMALEKILFFGLTIIDKRRVHYDRIDPAIAHELFLREGLALRQLNSTVDFWRCNEKFLTELEQLEERMRTRHFVPDDLWLYHFYQAKIPQTIASRVALEKWCQEEGNARKNDLYLTEAHLAEEKKEDKTAYPTECLWHDNRLKITYAFAPGTSEDGVSLWVPLPLLHSLSPALFDWLVPGLLVEKIHELLKGLPKEWRRTLMPLNEAANNCYQALILKQPTVIPKLDHGVCADTFQEDFFEQLAHVLQQVFHCAVTDVQLRAIPLPDFLQFNYKIAADEQVLAEGRDLTHLQQQYGARVAQPIEHLSVDDHWPQERVPDEIKIQEGLLTLVRYGALQAQAAGAQRVYVDSLLLAQQIHHWGVCKLLQLTHAEPLTYSIKKLLIPAVLAAGAAADPILKKSALPHRAENISAQLNKVWRYWAPICGAWSDFTDYFCYAVLSMTFAENFWMIRSSTDFETCCQTHAADLLENAHALVPVVQSLLTQLLRLHGCGLSITPVQELMGAGFLAVAPWKMIERYPYYVAAAAEYFLKGHSIEEYVQQVEPYTRLQKAYQELCAPLLLHARVHHLSGKQVASGPALWFHSLWCLQEAHQDFYFLLEEFKMTLLAPSFKPSEPVSFVRLEKILLHLYRSPLKMRVC